MEATPTLGIIDRDHSLKIASILTHKNGLEWYLMYKIRGYPTLKGSEWREYFLQLLLRYFFSKLPCGYPYG